MKVQSGKKTWLAAMAAAVLAGAGFACAGGDEETAPVPAAAETEQKAVPEPKGRQEIVGWQKAGETETVRNPFSLLHETAAGEQQAAAEMPAKPLQKEPLPSQPLLPRAQQPQNAEPPAGTGNAPPPSLKLKGLMEGEGGRIAMIQIGEQTASLSVGENFQDCTVLAIENNSIVIQAGGQERRLFLPEH